MDKLIGKYMSRSQGRWHKVVEVGYPSWRHLRDISPSKYSEWSKEQALSPLCVIVSEVGLDSRITPVYVERLEERTPVQTPAGEVEVHIPPTSKQTTYVVIDGVQFPN